MSAITQEFIEDSQREVESLSSLLVLYTSTFTSMAYFTLKAFLVYIDSKILIGEIIKSVKISTEMIDDSGNLVNRLERIQGKLKETYQSLSNKQYPFLFAAINRYLLKKTFNHFNLMIVNINEHDVDAENSYSIAFTSADDLIKHLNQ